MQTRAEKESWRKRRKRKENYGEIGGTEIQLQGFECDTDCCVSCFVMDLYKYDHILLWLKKVCLGCVVWLNTVVEKT
eukprot:759747-Hanusia_phi.AAC.2